MQSPLSQIERHSLARARGASLFGYVLAVLVLCLCLGTIGFRLASQTNHDSDPFDQSAYIAMAKTMKCAWYPWYSDGTRNPLFPWLTAKFLDPDAPSFFESGKKLNILFGLCGVALLAGIFITQMGPLAAFNATAVAGLAVLLPASIFFGAETLFFVLFLLVCACAMRLLNHNPPWLYAVLGALAGIAYLAKPSATPFLALFVVFSIAQLALSFFPTARLPWFLRATQWRAKNLLLGLALFGAIYFALIAPRLLHAQRTWGSAFYSLPGFWFWADDWETCVQKYYDCREERLAQLPPEEQPTLAGYFRRHTVVDAFQRAAGGATVRLTQLFYPEGKWRFPYEKWGKLKRVVLPYRGFYLLGLGLLATTMAAKAVSCHRLGRVGPVGLPVLLGLATLVLYIFAMGWYLPTGPGHRFIMTLYLPILWILAQGGEQLRFAANSRAANLCFLAGHAALATLVISRIAILLLDGQFEKISHVF